MSRSASSRRRGSRASARSPLPRGDRRGQRAPRPPARRLPPRPAARDDADGRPNPANNGDVGPMTYRIVPASAYGDGRRRRPNAARRPVRHPRQTRGTAGVPRPDAARAHDRRTSSWHWSAATAATSLRCSRCTRCRPPWFEAGMLARERLGRLGDMIHAAAIATQPAEPARAGRARNPRLVGRTHRPHGPVRPVHGPPGRAVPARDVGRRRRDAPPVARPGPGASRPRALCGAARAVRRSGSGLFGSSPTRTRPSRGPSTASPPPVRFTRSTSAICR